jgi:hypothetical protein
MKELSVAPETAVWLVWFTTPLVVYIAELAAGAAPLPICSVARFELTYTVCWIESGSENNTSGGGAAFEEPPNRLVIPEISPPNPAKLLNPPLTRLATPPEAVWESKPLRSVLPDELDVALLDGFPN